MPSRAAVSTRVMVLPKLPACENPAERSPPLLITFQMNETSGLVSLYSLPGTHTSRAALCPVVWTKNIAVRVVLLQVQLKQFRLASIGSLMIVRAFNVAFRRRHVKEAARRDVCVLSVPRLPALFTLTLARYFLDLLDAEFVHVLVGHIPTIAVVIMPNQVVAPAPHCPVRLVVLSFSGSSIVVRPVLRIDVRIIHVEAPQHVFHLRKEMMRTHQAIRLSHEARHESLKR